MSRTRRALLACCACVALPCVLACSSDPAEGAGGSGGSAGAKDGGGGTAGGSSACEPGELDLAGTWAIFLQYSIALQKQEGGAIRMCPEDQVSSSTMFLLLDVAQDGTAITAKPVNCSLTLPEVTGLVGDCDPAAKNLVTVSILAPPELVASMPETAMSPAAGTLSAVAPGSTLTMSDPFLFLTGSSKGGAELPKWVDTNDGCGVTATVGRDGQCVESCVSDCASLTDSDHDGKVGVTFHVCGLTPDDKASKVKCNATDPASAGPTIQGTAFLDFETDPRITGTVKSSCEVVGTFASTTTYHLVGADLTLSNTSISVASSIKSLPTYLISPTQSKFRMLRVDGKRGAADWKVDLGDPKAACAVAIQHQNELQ